MISVNALWRFLFAPTVVCVVGCTVKPTDSLPARAAYDMQCPAASLKVTPIAGYCDVTAPLGATCTVLVDGCSHQATYVYNRENYTWLMNSPLRDTSAVSTAR
jgi:hypothetical protein